MVHSGIFATAAECASKVGELKDSTGWIEVNINQWCAESESYINLMTKKNWSDLYSSLNEDFKKILTEASSNLVAMYGIIFNMSGYTSRGEAELMINVLYQRAMDCIKLLTEPGAEKLLETGS